MKRRRLLAAALLLFTCAAFEPARAAELGVELPTMGISYDGGWVPTLHKYFGPAVLRDIRDNLHATYVRTGWIPSWIHKERQKWLREDKALDAICGSGLHAMIIVPSLRDDKYGEDDLVDSVDAFFARYTLREPGCIRYVEISNEADLPKNGFSDAQTYAKFYERIAPIVAKYRLPIVTTGVSGLKLGFTEQLQALLRTAIPAPTGYGFHPYGVAAAQIPEAMLQMRAACGGAPVFITEIGRNDGEELYRTMIALATLTPALTIYEYQAQPGESDEYALLQHPDLYRAVVRGSTYFKAAASQDAVRVPASYPL